MIEKYKALEDENERLKGINSALCTKSNSYLIQNARLEEERDELKRQLAELKGGLTYRNSLVCRLEKQLAEYKADAERYRNIKPIIDAFPEINPSNYDHDDACNLNAWGVELVLADEAMKGATE